MSKTQNTMDKFLLKCQEQILASRHRIFKIKGQLLLQKNGVNKISTVKISKRPMSINKERKSFPNALIPEKLQTGHTPPIEGPTLPILVAVAPIAVSKSRPVAAITILPKPNIIK